MSVPAGPEWGQVLRALVYRAYDARGTDEHEAALNDVVDAFYDWPLVEAQWYLDAARDERTQRVADQQEAVEIVRESYGVAA